MNKSPIQVKNLIPISGKEAEQLKKIWGVEKLIILAAKGNTWTAITRHTDSIDEIECAKMLLDQATEGME